MATPVFDIDVQGLTFDDLLDDARELAKKLLPDWDYTNPNDPVVYLMELYLSSLDRESFFANLLAQEFALDTAMDRRSIYSHAKRLGYIPKTRQPALVEVTISVVSSPIVRTIDPYEMRIGTAAAGAEDSVPFENIAQITIPAMATSVSAVQFAHGESVVDAFVSSGKPFQKFALTRRPIMLEEQIPESFILTVDAIPWTRVEGFGDAGPTDEVFVLDLDFDGTGFVIFGDGNRGKLPPNGGAISIFYRVGGGTVGNVAQDTIDVLLDAPSYVQGVSNPNPATGGREEESPDHIKIYAPIAIREGGQLNTLDAVRAYLESLTSIARAKPFLQPGQKIQCYVLMEQGFTLTPSFSESVENDVLERLVMGFTIELLPPKFKETDVTVVAYAVRGSDRQEVENAVNDAIDDWLDPLAVDADGNFLNDFGEDVRISDLGLLLKEIPQVFDYIIIAPEENISLDADQLPTPVHTDTVRSVEVVLEGDVGFTTSRMSSRNL